ncbi:MAG: hypothetical protein II916_08235 [Oscillospiraceae bacterium]|nr:hypothetical protein [Oscillospiraceae bacterium]
MKERGLRKLWSMSLLVISCISLVLSVSNLASIELPDLVKRILGVLILLGIPVLVYSSVKLKIWKKDA